MVKPRELPPLEYLRECFSYDPESGILRWIERPKHHFSSIGEYNRFKTSRVGKEAGRTKRDGYREVRLDGRYMTVHRLCFYLYYGKQPENHIDHVNGNKTDNRISNLREATSTQNNHNRSLSKRNTTGYKGVYVDSKHNRFKSSIRVGEGRRLFLGYFDTAEEAAYAYCVAAEKYHGDFAKQLTNKG